MSLCCTISGDGLYKQGSDVNDVGGYGTYEDGADAAGMRVILA